MALFTLQEVDNINGKQLADEIFQETGITITVDDVLYQGDGIVFIRDELVGDQATAIQAIVDVHSIDPDYFPEDVEIRNANINFDDAKDRLLSSNIADMTPEQIFMAMQNQMDSWTTLADARASLREWLPMMASVIVWLVRKDQ